MAAAIVPLVAAIAAVTPDIIKLIASLVHHDAPVVEQRLGNGTGPVKFATVFGGVVAALTKAAEADQIPKQLPSDETIKVVIQAVISSMQLSGMLGESPAVPVVTAVAQSVVLTAGQSLTISVR